MNLDFKGQVALVVGGTSGIGAATAAAYVEAGAAVMIAGRSADAGEDLAARLRSRGGTALFHRCDLQREDEVEAMMARVDEAYGRLDCAANCAGITLPPQRTHETPTALFDEVLAVNLRGIFLAMKHELAMMLRVCRGAIVNVGSTAGHVGFAGFCHYAASKHGLVGLTRAAAMDYAREGIRVNGVSPGPVDTPLLRRGLAALGQTMEDKVSANPMRRAGSPAELADIILWLSSAQSAYVTGHFVNADGGYTIQ